MNRLGKRRKPNCFRSDILWNMLTSVLIFVVVLSILIFVHELGHFLVAKKNGIWVEEFGFGLPPRVFGKKIGETIYSINLFPFGGFVRLHGENSEEGITNPKRAFLMKSKKARFAVVVAGVIMNFILAIVAFSIVYSFSGIPRDTKQVTIIDVTVSSPAQIGGLIVGDVIKKVDGADVTSVDDFIARVDAKKGKKVFIETDRGRVVLTPRANPPEGEGPLGVVISTTEIYWPPVVQRPFYGAYYGFKEALFWGKTVVIGFATIIQGLFKGIVPKDVAGPVGIFAVTTEAARMGMLAVINFVGILSVNLAILNIIPFPALDGGRLLFIGIEAVTRKRVTSKIESAIHTVGFVILIALILLITIQDIRHVIAAGGISGFIKSMVK